MSKKESRRRVPLAAVAMVALSLLFVFEALVIAGAFGVKSSTVARIAPWAYEPFLKLVGEHPESERWKDRSRKEPEADISSGMASVAGLNAEGVIIDMGAPAAEDADVNPERAVSGENRSNTVPDGASATNPVPERSGDVVPVG